MSLIRSNNITSETGDETKKIYVYYKDFKNTPSDKTPSAIAKAVRAGQTYNIDVQNDSASDDEIAKDTAITDTTPAYYKSGYIKIIKVTENKVSSGNTGTQN